MTQIAPDIERTLVHHLLSDPRITDVVGDRIGTRTPGTLRLPWVRVTLLNTQTSSRPLHLINALVQIDCYAGDDEAIARSQASELARHVQHAIEMLPNTELPDLVVSSVAHLGLRPLPDETLEPPRERFILTEEIVVHP